MALRGGRFSGQAYDTLAEGTVRSAISYVAQTFRDNDRPNPTKDEDGELGRLLSRLYRSFKNDDPNPIQQKALPACVLRELAKLTSSETPVWHDNGRGQCKTQVGNFSLLSMNRIGLNYHPL